jgi:UDP-N-acetylglucosamine 2-epimerase (non-hydrolysing)
MKNVSIILGTRPEAIKLAPVILALQKHPGITTRVCVTGQHREMLDQVLRVFDIVPDEDMGLMRPDQSLSEFAARALQALHAYLEDDRPDLVLVQGDTTTTFVASLAAFYHKIAIGHVEAGLRTFTKYAPFPEEIHRLLTSRLADYHFAPTETSRVNLQNEGIPGDRIFVTGNTVVDALFFALDKIRNDRMEERLLQQLSRQVPGIRSVITDDAARLILVTGHRRENFGRGFEQICRALKRLAEREGVQIIFPVHLNPRVRKPVSRILGKTPGVHLIEPLDYLPFVYLMDQCVLILTDSGGIQEEAPSLGKPVLVMREVSERPEALEAGTAVLVGADADSIVRGVSSLLTDADARKDMTIPRNPFGDGKAARRIADVLAAEFTPLENGTAEGTVPFAPGDPTDLTRL